MLTLSRRTNETVVIVDNETGQVIVTATVFETRPNKVYLGFDADKKRYAVHRLEVLNRIREVPSNGSN